jgi:hypothetical protein
MSTTTRKIHQPRMTDSVMADVEILHMGQMIAGQKLQLRVTAVNPAGESGPCTPISVFVA